MEEIIRSQLVNFDSSCVLSAVGFTNCYPPGSHLLSLSPGFLRVSNPLQRRWGQVSEVQILSSEAPHLSTEVSAGDLGCRTMHRRWQSMPVAAPAVPRHPLFCWNRCCAPLISDPKIQGVLGCLWGAESSGDHGTACQVQAQGGLALVLTGRNLIV